MESDVAAALPNEKLKEFSAAAAAEVPKSASKMDAAAITPKAPITLLPLPVIPAIDSINKQFAIEGLNIEVTSVDITSHGCFAVVGCSNGMVLLFDMVRLMDIAVLFELVRDCMFDSFRQFSF